jgi:regulator of sigma E protease
MDKLQALIAFFVALGPLVVAHELGHYGVARLCGVKVLRFSIGLGRVLWSRRYGPDQTEWAISLWPLGGYVKMLDAREESLDGLPPADLSREFTHQNVWKRIAIVAAGPIANFVLAITLLTGLFMVGVPDPATTLRAVLENSAAHQAGLRGGDRIVAVNDQPVLGWTEMRWEILQAALQPQTRVQLQVQRTGSGRVQLELPLAGLSHSDLEGNFLTKLGLELASPPAVLGTVMADGPAARAGFMLGDKVLTVNRQPVQDARDLIDLVKNAPGKNLLIGGVSDKGRAFERQVVPESVKLEQGSVGRIAVAFAGQPESVTLRYGLLPAIGKGVEKTWSISTLTLKVLGKMLVGQASLKNITGPLTIADFAGQSVRMGPASFISFVALISISLGVMNLLPIPVLDGGFLLYYSLEVLMGRPLPERIADMAQRIGIGMLVLLMSVALFNDVTRYLP